MPGNVYAVIPPCKPIRKSQAQGKGVVKAAAPKKRKLSAAGRKG
jgi:hypothetical protein